MLATASVVADLFQRKQWFKILFNLGQYTLALAAAGLTVEAFHGQAPFR